MNGWEDIVKLAGLIFGASGLWKLIELFYQSRLEKRLKTAEAKNLHAQAEGQIVGNWIQWSQHLEQRVRELEAVAEENRNLTMMVKTQREMIDSQKSRISELEEKVNSLQKENESLRGEIAKLNSDKE